MKKIFFSGINGIGMSGLALILKDLGYEITGSDIALKPITEVLKNKGIKVFLDQKVENAQSDNFDTYVHSSAIKENNPEYMFFKEKNVPILKRGELLAKIMENLKTSIAVAGTHGKTTTSSMLSVALLSLDPYIAVGGIIPEINSNSKVGNSKNGIFIAEADESDNSFLYMNPTYSIITNIEADHLEFHKNLDNIKNSFSKFIKQTKNKVLACYDCEILKSFKNDKMIYYSTNENNKEHVSIYAKNIKIVNNHTEFEVIKDNVNLGIFKLSVPGLHNVANSLPVIYLALENNININALKESLQNFKGANRRYQVIYNENIKIIDDYAHHPTEIKATIQAAKSIEDKEIVVIFEPHRYSRTSLLLHDFAKSLSFADKIYLLDIYPASEENIYNISSQNLADLINKDVHLCSNEKVYDILKENKYKVYLFMGAGKISSIAHDIVRRLKSENIK